MRALDSNQPRAVRKDCFVGWVGCGWLVGDQGKRNSLSVAWQQLGRLRLRCCRHGQNGHHTAIATDVKSRCIYPSLLVHTRPPPTQPLPPLLLLPPSTHDTHTPRHKQTHSISLSTNAPVRVSSCLVVPAAARPLLPCQSCDHQSCRHNLVIYEGGEGK